MTTTNPTVTVDEIGVWPLEGLDGKEGRVLLVDVPSSAHAPLHHHDGWQFIYVLEGSVTSQMREGPSARVLSHRAGQAGALVRYRRNGLIDG